MRYEEKDNVNVSVPLGNVERRHPVGVPFVQIILRGSGIKIIGHNTIPGNLEHFRVNHIHFEINDVAIGNKYAKLTELAITMF